MGVMSMIHHVPAVATTWINHGRKKMKQFIDKEKNANLENEVEYFAVGLVLKEYPDTPSGKEVFVGFIDPWGSYITSWRARSEIVMSDISDFNAELLKMAFKDAEET